MRRLGIAIALFLLATTVRAELRGAWTASIDDKDSSRIYLNVVQRHSNNGQTMRLSAFSGLSESQVRSTSQTPVQFAMRREAGTLSFEGVFKEGMGAGQFSFTPNNAYIEDIRNLGVETRAERSHGDDDEGDRRLMQLALHDVSTDFIRTMQSLGYRVSLDKYIAFRIFGVTPELVSEFRSLGYDHLSADNLVATQIHGATPKYIRELRAAGFETSSIDDAIATRIHGATPEFAREMADLGYRNLRMDNLVAFRIHGVTPQFIRELADLGYRDVPADQLIAMRIHGVSPRFIRELAEAGYRNVPVEKLVAMRIHGVDADFIRKVK